MSAVPTFVTSGDSIARRFPSLAALQFVHTALLKRQRADGEKPTFRDAVFDFLNAATATGAVLDADADRRSVQTILDYWATRLYRIDEAPADTTLAEFDPLLAPELPDELCPYLGLDAFREGDTNKFFGRNDLVTRLIDRLNGQRLLVIVGPSGSGKSSVVRAGLIPALQAGALPGSRDWRYLAPIVPGSEPLASLARLLKPRSAQPACSRCGKLTRSGQKFCPSCGAPVIRAESDRRRSRADQTTREMLQSLLSELPSAAPPAHGEWLKRDRQYLAQQLSQQSPRPAVVVVDQFEEVFTLCKDVPARELFIGNLLELVTASAPEHRVILTMRQDFETYASQTPELEALFKTGRVTVTPLSAGEMRDAIEQPANRVGLKFEAGIIDGLLQDILGEPAGLPLLQFTLLKLWERRERNRVTLKAYERVGGGRLALARSADEIYGKLIPEDQRAAKRILLRMVQPGEGLEVTSRRIRRDELARLGEDPGRIERVLARLIESRLVRLTAGETPADDQIEVAHEALVRNWPKLVDWLDEEREHLRKRARLTAAAQQWRDSDCDPSRLWRGAPLEEVISYKDLSDLESEFVKTSQATERREIELEQKQKAQLRRIKKYAIWQASFVWVGIALYLIVFLVFIIQTLTGASQKAPSPWVSLLPTILLGISLLLTNCLIPILAIIVLVLSLGGRQNTRKALRLWLQRKRNKARPL